MTKHVCAFSGRAAEHGHHATGRGADGRYLDPDLVIPLTRRMHVVEHVALRRSGLDDPTTMSSALLRLRRAGHLFVRLGEHHGEGSVIIPARFVGSVGHMLVGVADELGGEA